MKNRMMNTRTEKKTLGLKVIVQSTTILSDVMVTYVTEQNCNDSSDCIINGSRFTCVTFIGYNTMQYSSRHLLMNKNRCCLDEN